MDTAQKVEIQTGLVKKEGQGDSLKRLAVFYKNRENFEKAAEFAQRYLEVNPGDEEMEALLTNTRRALAEGGLAYEQAITNEPPHQVLIRQLSTRRAR